MEEEFTKLKLIIPKSEKHNASKIIATKRGKILGEGVFNCNVKIYSGEILNDCILLIRINKITLKQEVLIDGEIFYTPKLSRTLFQFLK